MKLEKAIEINTEILRDGTEPGYPDSDNALKLGIEALKRIVYLRLDMDCPHWMTLPGETNE